MEGLMVVAAGFMVVLMVIPGRVYRGVNGGYGRIYGEEWAGLILNSTNSFVN
jgi:hypothetical protein